MAKRSSSPVEQQLAQLEYLGNNQLKQLLVDLESKKRQLPVEDHAIIDWGINTLKAKILDEERLMSETGEDWKHYCTNKCKSFIEKYQLDHLDLTTDVGKASLYSACYNELREIFLLASPGTYREDDFRLAVDIFKDNLEEILEAQQLGELYETYIQKLKENYKPGYGSQKYSDVYEKLLFFLVGN